MRAAAVRAAAVALGAPVVFAPGERLAAQRRTNPRVLPRTPSGLAAVASDTMPRGTAAPYRSAADSTHAPAPARPSGSHNAAESAASAFAVRLSRGELPWTDPLGIAAPAVHFDSRRDSLAWVAARRAAARASGQKIVISLFDRQLWVVRGADTLRAAPVAVGMDSTLRFGERTWRFETPRGRRTVLRKEADPVWIPPDWHYVEFARAQGFRLRRLRPGQPVPLRDGSVLTVRGDRVGVVRDGAFTPVPLGDEIVFDSTAFIPPLGTRNRQIPNELGKFRLILGDGYLLHGTPHRESIGAAATHGCIRLGDDDIAWLYDNVPVGTRVYIY